MSATTDRVDAIARDVAPYPYRPSDVVAAAYHPELFASLVSLTQAYPHLRDDIHRLERQNAALMAQNAALAAERDQAARAIRAAVTAHSEGLRRCRDRCAKLLAGDPVRLEFAVRLAESADPHHAGARGVWLWVDGDALAAWRSAS